MKILVQKVLSAAVHINNELISQINAGYLLFIGIEKNDTADKADYLAKKIANLRIFTDENDKMNLSIKDTGGEVLAVSQFTLAADLSRGNRPGFDNAAAPEDAKKLYEYCVKRLQVEGLSVQTGIFQADMKVSLVNDGPCTFLLCR